MLWMSLCVPCVPSANVLQSVNVVVASIVVVRTPALSATSYTSTNAILTALLETVLVAEIAAIDAKPDR
jgi:hypothetical protein